MKIFGRKKQKQMPDEPLIETEAVVEETADDGFSIREPKINKNSLDFEPLPHERYGESEFKPKKPEKVMIMSPKGYSLAVSCMEVSHGEKAPQYSSEFIRTCLYSKNGKLSDIIRFCMTYPDYSGLKNELISKMKYENGFATVSKLSRILWSVKNLGKDVKDRIHMSIASAVIEFIKGRNSYNYVVSVLEEGSVAECRLQDMFPVKDVMFGAAVPKDNRPLFVLMTDAVHNMMDASPDPDDLNRIYFDLQRMLRTYDISDCDYQTKDCFWKNIIRFMGTENDIRHFGSWMADAYNVLEENSRFPEDVSSAYWSTVNRLFAEPAKTGEIKFGDLRDKALAALYLSRYMCSKDIAIEQPVLDLLCNKLSEAEKPSDMSEMYSAMSGYIANYNQVLKLNITSQDLLKTYENAVIEKVRNASGIKESNSWYSDTVPKVTNDSMKDVMIGRYTDALRASKSPDELIQKYSEIGDPFIRDSGSEVFAECFVGCIGESTGDEFRKYMSELGGKTYVDTVIHMGKNYNGRDKDVCRALLSEINKELFSRDHIEGWRSTITVQSEHLIKDFALNEYDECFVGYKVIDSDKIMSYLALLRMNGNHFDEMMALCCLMENSGYGSKLDELFTSGPWYESIDKDPVRRIVFSNGYFEEMAGPDKPLEERIAMMRECLDALLSIDLNTPGTRKYLQSVRDSVDAAYKRFGSEVSLDLTRSVLGYLASCGIPSIEIELSYAFNLILEEKYEKLPELNDESIALHPDESELYRYVCKYMEWFGRSAAFRVERFPLDIDVPLKHAESDYQKAMVYYIRTAVSNFYGNASLVYDGKTVIGNLIKSEPEYALLKKKTALLAYKQRILDGVFDNDSIFGEVMDCVELIDDSKLRKLLRLYATFCRINDQKASTDSMDRILLTNELRSFTKDESLLPEYIAAARYIDGCVQMLDMRSSSRATFEKALSDLKNSVFVWEDWPKPDSKGKYRYEGRCSPVDNSILYADIKYHIGLCKRIRGEEYHDDMIEAIEKIVYCPKSERINILKKKIDNDNKVVNPIFKVRSESSESGGSPMRAFESGNARYQFETASRNVGGHYSVHLGYRISDDGTQGMKCVMKAPKGVRFLVNATSVMDEDAYRAFDTEVECWDMLSEECPDKVVRLLDHGKSPHLYTISQYADITLKEGMLNMNRRQVIEAMQNVLGALAVIHEAGMIYNDMKSENIMRADGVWKLNDFDSVTFGGDSNAGNKHLTQLYNSPEQAEGRTVTEKSDIWSAGVVLYECINKGAMPFKDQDAIKSMQYDDIRTVGTDYDRLFKMIFTVPEGRPSAKDLISILDEIKRKEM